MSKYLLLKLAEEASELATAAIKHSMHGDSTSLAALEGEVADTLALVQLTMPTTGSKPRRVVRLIAARVKRETRRAKERR